MGHVTGTDDLFQAEIKVKKFMIKYAKYLGISDEDVAILKEMLGQWQ